MKSEHSNGTSFGSYSQSPVGINATMVWPWAIIALLTFAFLLLWPVLRGIVAASDDLGLVMVHFDYPSLLAAFKGAWHQPLFRPLAVISGFLTDPATRTGPLVMLLHASALVIGALGLDCIVKVRLGDSAVNRWTVQAFWLLHPATSVSLWQMDTVSQTASAAAGLWLMALSFDAWRPRHRSLVWCLVTCVGLMTKETFLGWVLAGAVVGAAKAWDQHTWAQNKGEIFGVVIGIIFVILRVMQWDVGILLSGERRYSVHMGLPILRNVALSTAGFLVYGPQHSLRLAGPGELSWVLAALGAISHFIILIAAGSKRWGAVAFYWGLAILALAPVLVMEHVSELYLFGPNALVVLALTEALSKTSTRMVRTCIVLLVGAGCFGHVARARHFGQTWYYTRTLAQQVERIALYTATPAPLAPCGPAVMYHSVYVVSPVGALSPSVTQRLMEKRGHPLPANWLSRLDCVGLDKMTVW